jgi:hypothetical protein
MRFAHLRKVAGHHVDPVRHPLGVDRIRDSFIPESIEIPGQKLREVQMSLPPGVLQLCPGITGLRGTYSTSSVSQDHRRPVSHVGPPARYSSSFCASADKSGIVASSSTVNTIP